MKRLNKGYIQIRLVDVLIIMAIIGILLAGIIPAYQHRNDTHGYWHTNHKHYNPDCYDTY